MSQLEQPTSLGPGQPDVPPGLVGLGGLSLTSTQGVSSRPRGLPFFAGQPGASHPVSQPDWAMAQVTAKYVEGCQGRLLGRPLRQPSGRWTPPCANPANGPSVQALPTKARSAGPSGPAPRPQRRS